MTGTRKLLYQAAEQEEGQAELSEFLKGVEKRAFRMAEIETRNRDDALEIVQESMLRLVQKYQHRPAAEWKPLFYRILQNGIMDFHRKTARQNLLFAWRNRNEPEEEDRLSMLEHPGLDPASECQQGLTMDRLQQSLKQLSVRQRQAFLLRIWEGFDVAATAKIMRCSQGSVKTHLSRALQQLRSTLEEFV